MSYLGAAGPRWFSIPAHRPFLDDLAAGVWRALSRGGQEAVSEAIILLPTRRAARGLARAFVDLAGGAVLPPLMRALGDLDEVESPFEPGETAVDLPPGISPARRRFELAGLVAKHEGELGRTLDAGAALALADALAALLDSLQLEEAGPDVDFATLVEADMAEHWRASAAFLGVAVREWPARLAELGLMDVAARRVALLRALERRWREAPPPGPLIAAGSTGSTPATADLLKAVAAAPAGCVVLPGLDVNLAETAWIEVDDQHPQGALKRLLQRAGVARADVLPWDPAAEAGGRWRRRIINEALRPPNATADWLEVIKAIQAEGPGDPIAEGLDGLALVSAEAEEEAATLAALMLRQALETPGRTAALVTPDAGLARRVSARLTRWNIAADSSVGQSLAGTAPAVLAALVARAVVDPADPVTLLAILKHPLTRLGRGERAMAAARAALERQGLRGVRPGSWQALDARLTSEPARDLASRLRSAVALAQTSFGATASPTLAARALAQAMEALAAGSDGAAGGLWAGQAGEAVASILASLMADSAALPDVTPSGFSELIAGLMQREPLRAGGASHPRLAILGVLEARLTRFDLLILAGLEEGVWPATAPIDPFLSRPMRRALGLPAPERFIGLSAHDFAQAACAPEVVLLHTRRRGTAPTVESRWLWRLRTLAKGAGVELPGRPDMLDLARALDAPLRDPPAALRTADRPAPTPPTEVRPRQLPVTAVERWVRDPYGLYAQRILKLRPLEPPDAPVEAMARGAAVHRALERFVLAHPEVLPDEPEAAFAAQLVEALVEAGFGSAAMVREGALAANVAPWIIDFERRRRPGASLRVEQTGTLTFDAPGGPFTLTARADRIEVRGDHADILDFKTGRPPSPSQVEQGLSPQLTLTAAILAAGGFPDIGPLTPGELLYVRVSGGRKPGSEDARGEGETAAWAARALAGLKRRVAHFDQQSTSYPSWALPQFISAYGGDYDHLARLWEWLVVGEAGEDEAP